MMLKTRVDSWGSLIISNCDILWLLEQEPYDSRLIPDPGQSGMSTPWQL